MTPAFVIAKKRDGGTLSAVEIRAFIAGYVDGSVPDYQMAAIESTLALQAKLPLVTPAGAPGKVGAGVATPAVPVPATAVGAWI